MDKRFAQLADWVTQVLGHKGLRIEPASGDASFRRYFRVYTETGSYIVMDAPPEKENSEPFIRVAGWLGQTGLTVPEVLQQQPDSGFYLLTDLGNRQYLSQLDQSSADKLYADAIQALIEMQVQGARFESALPPYDRQQLLREMGLFRDWYLGRHLGIELDAAQQQTLEVVYNHLVENALDQPGVFVHRDYHSRNLMYQADKQRNPGILDFQDAMYGPVTYDLVSLLRDCYIRWPEEYVDRWVRYHYDALRERGQLQEVSYSQYKRWFDLMGVQRHLKATGIFARLNYRDNKPGYLNDIPRTLNYVLQVSVQYPELTPFHRLLTDLSVSARIAAESLS